MGISILEIFTDYIMMLGGASLGLTMGVDVAPTESYHHLPLKKAIYGSPKFSQIHHNGAEHSM